jgi:hypothetical protein
LNLSKAEVATTSFGSSGATTRIAGLADHSLLSCIRITQRLRSCFTMRSMLVLLYR